MNFPTLYLVAVFVGVVVGYARRGRLQHMQWLPLWSLIVPWPAVALQVLPGWLPVLHHDWTLQLLLLLATYVIVAGFLAGLWLMLRQHAHARAMEAAVAMLAVGWLMNITVISANGGMPVSRAALVRAGYASETQLGKIEHVRKHVLASSQTSLKFLGDVIPIHPLRRVISLGDIVFLAGISAFLAAGMMYAPASGHGSRNGARQRGPPDSERRVSFPPVDLL